MVIPDVPPIFSVPVAPLVNVPVPDRPAVTVSVPLLVIVPVIATLGIVIALVPPMVFVAPENVWVPELAVYVPLLERLPAILTATFVFSLRVIPLSIVMSAQVAVVSIMHTAWISTLSDVLGAPLGLQLPAVLHFPSPIPLLLVKILLILLKVV